MKCARHLWKEEGWQQRERGSGVRWGGGVEIDESLLKVLAVENDGLKIIRPYNALERKRKGKAAVIAKMIRPLGGTLAPLVLSKPIGSARAHISGFFSLPPPLHSVSNIPPLK